MFRTAAHFLSYQMATRLWPVRRNQLWICRHLMFMLDSTFVLRHFQHTPLWRSVARITLLASVFGFFQPGTLVPGTRLAPQPSISFWSPQYLCWECQSEPYLVDIYAYLLLSTYSLTACFLCHIWSFVSYCIYYLVHRLNSLLIFPPLSCCIFVLHLLAGLVFFLIFSCSVRFFYTSRSSFPYHRHPFLILTWH